MIQNINLFSVICARVHDNSFSESFSYYTVQSDLSVVHRNHFSMLM